MNSGECKLAQSNPTVVAVIPTLGKNLKRLQCAIESIKLHSTYSNLKIVVVDNSPDGTLSDFDLADEVIWTGINLGWVGSLEYIRNLYDFEYYWTVQDDMTMLNDVLGILLIELLNEPELGVVSPVLIRNGVIPARTRGGIFTDEKNIKWINIPEKDIEPEFFVQDYDLCFVSGSGALWRKSALNDISGFDLNLYPLVHVDVDTCLRLRERNWQLKLLSNAHITHEIRGSTSEILGNTLHYINEDLVRNKFLIKEATKRYSTNELDKDFLYTISKKSSYLFLDISRNAQLVIKRLEDEKSALEKEFLTAQEVNKRYEIINNEIVNSKSWKITKPLRIFSNYIKKLDKLKIN